MFEDNSDDEPTLEDLFETEDTDPLDDLDDLDSSTDETDTETPVASTDESSADDQPDWADDVLDTQSDDDPAETPEAAANESEAATPALEEQSNDEQSPETVTSASGANVSAEDSSLVVSKASLPTNLLSLSDDSSPEWLSTLIWYAKYFVAKLFRIVMTPAIFLVAFLAGAGGWLVFKALALGIFIAFFKMWLNNPLGMSMTEQYIASAVLIVGFVFSVFADFAVEDYYENNYGA